MRNKYSESRKTNLFTIYLGFYVIIIAAITILTTPIVQTSYSSYIERVLNSDTITSIFLLMLGGEIPQFRSSLDEIVELPSISNLIFKSVTGINTDDISTLLLHEIPGFNNSFTKIYIAGEGSNYSNLPIESPPPNFDELLKEQGSNEKEQKDIIAEDNDINDTQNPSVFIYHSHSWEGFLPLIDDENIKPSDSSSTNTKENVVLVGSMLAAKFKEYGINTVHNTINTAKALRDKGWDYNNSYALSREYVETAASQNKNIEYYIDIHRDSARKETTSITINGKGYAKLYFVVGQAHENYKGNLMFAEEIHESLNEKYPGLSRGVYLKTEMEGNGVYNQDISNKSLLLEVGGIDNEEIELQNSVDAFAEIFSELYDGAIEVNAPNH